MNSYRPTISLAVVCSRTGEKVRPENGFLKQEDNNQVFLWYGRGTRQMRRRHKPGIMEERKIRVYRERRGTKRTGE